jgi:hypothetical protein
VISLSLFDLDGLDDLAGDNLSLAGVLVGAAAMLLAILIAKAVRARVARSPVERLLHKHFGM